MNFGKERPLVGESNVAWISIINNEALAKIPHQILDPPRSCNGFVFSCFKRNGVSDPWECVGSNCTECHQLNPPPTFEGVLKLIKDKKAGY